MEDLSGMHKVKGERREQKSNRPQPSKRVVLGGAEARSSFVRTVVVSGSQGGGH